MHRLGHLLHGFACVIHQLHTVGHALARLFYQRRNLFHRVGAALREASDFACHHREAAALFARARRLYRGVKRQDIGLERDAIDHRGDIADFLRAVVDLRHRLHYLADQRFAAAGDLGGVGGELGGVMRVGGVMFHGRADLLHAGGGLLQRGGLLFSPRGEVNVAADDFACALTHRVARLFDLPDNPAQLRLHGVKRVEQAAAIARFNGNHVIELAVRHRQRNGRGFQRLAAQRLEHFTAKDDAQQRAHQQNADHHKDNGVHQLAIRGGHYLAYRRHNAQIPVIRAVADSDWLPGNQRFFAKNGIVLFNHMAGKTGGVARERFAGQLFIRV
ncbi:hypothetical protein BN136_4275 [Cronobacter universalis NCTC 9529]|nr:hypothetical protein BN136_4275 [Cronobacter universalis NCTC 9529]